MIYARYIYLYAYMHIYVCYVLLTYIRIHMDICTYGVYIIDTKSIKELTMQCTRYDCSVTAYSNIPAHTHTHTCTHTQVQCANNT